jgi:O-antigen/teichoic acid export membrane protein
MIRKHHSIARNAVLSILGQVGPAVAAVFALPLLARTLGVERLGFLSLVWIVIGYFSLLDFGLGLGVTKSVAAVLGTDAECRVPEIFWTAWITQGCLGIAGGLLLWSVSPLLAGEILHVPQLLQAETVRALHLCAAALPVIVMTPSLIGVLQAKRRFDITVLIQTPFAVGQYVLPYVCARHGMDLGGLIGVLLLSRIVSFLLLGWAAAVVTPRLLQRPVFTRAEFRALIGFGGWVTAGTLIAPVVLYADRFLISRVLSLSFVAYYSVPADALMRLLIAPSCIVSVLFPSFSQMREKAEGDAVRELAHRSIQAILYLMVVPLGAVMICASDLMTLWMGAPFAAQASIVLRILVVGTLANSVARVPYGLLQAIGRPDLPSKLQFVELPTQLVLSLVLTVRFGLCGAAAAWSLRLTAEMAILLYLAHRNGGLSLGHLRADRALPAGALILAPAVVLAAIVPGLPAMGARLAVEASWLLWSFAILYTRGLTPADKLMVSRAWVRAS